VNRHRLLSAAVAAAALASVAATSPGGVAPAARPSPPPLTRYSLVHGCYSLRSPSGQPIASSFGPFRMQAAALGVYLLYGPRGDYLTGPGASASSASSAAEWRVDGSSRGGFRITNLASGTSLPVAFVPASGCAVYPEAQVDASGPSFTGASPQASVLGTVEGHAHVTAFELFGGDWHCGQPFYAFGAPYALPGDCSPDEQGTNGEFEAFLDFGGPTRPSDMHGWPTFKHWPSPTAIAEEGDYYTGIERAWKAGLRVMVTDLVDNEALCSLMTKKHNPCNDMASVHIQDRDLHALQDYIDAQSGGPGQGWLRLVTDPFQARRVINEGKLAVIEGIEVSRIFGCGEHYDVPECGRAQVDAGLKEVHDLGVRTFFPVHEFDNAFGGTKMISGSTGAIVNAGNRDETGSFWQVQSCPAQVQDAPQVTAPATGTLANLLNGPVATTLGGGVAPVYPPGPHCNVRGLTDLGGYLIGQMIKQHFVIQTDHMSSKSATAALDIAERAHYAGVVSAHCCSSPQLFGRIYSTGGAVTPPVLPAGAFVAQWRVDKGVSDSRYTFGFGWGSDMNGLAQQPASDSSAPISYPFRSYDGRVTFTREQWGQRTFDFNTDGLANYGLYADWLQQVQRIGGAPVMNDLFNGAESYLDMWERAYGVPATTCRPRGERFSRAGLGSAIRLGDTPQAALYRAGQPSARSGRFYRYCAAGGSVAALFKGGRVALVASNVHGDTARGIGPGSRAGGLRVRRVTASIFVGRKLRGGARYVYVVRGGRVRFVALASAAELHNRGRLRADLRAAKL